MNTDLKTCKHCLLHENVHGVSFNDDGLCNLCSDYKSFKPYGETNLVEIFEKARKKKRVYDALVPISGGKDSMYILYLAVKKYGLKVLTYTFDNGFMSEIAIKNINNAIKKYNVDHKWYRFDEKLIYELYRTSLINSGEICGICGIGIEAATLKISETWHTPLILLGHTPTEDNSFTSENIYDTVRMKAILNGNPRITKEDINRFLIYPNRNYISNYIYTRLGRFGKKVFPMYYINLPTEKEMAETLVKEMDWEEKRGSEYTRHFDCIAEPFTNFIRDKRLGYSRLICHLSNLIRTKEFTREKAMQIYADDYKNPLPADYELILRKLNITDTDIDHIVKVDTGKFENKISSANKIFEIIRNIVKKNKH